MRFSENKIILFWVVLNVTTVKFMCARLLNSITHAFNLLKTCDDYRPKMENILFRYYDR